MSGNLRGILAVDFANGLNKPGVLCDLLWCKLVGDFLGKIPDLPFLPDKEFLVYCRSALHPDAVEDCRLVPLIIPRKSAEKTVYVLYPFRPTVRIACEFLELLLLPVCVPLRQRALGGARQRRMFPLIQGAFDCL